MNNDIILTEFARVINSDRYQYTESDIFLVENMQNKIAVFDMFFRKTEDGGFAVVSGIQEVIHLIEVLNTTSEEEKRKYFSKVLEEKHLIDFLSKMKFTGDLYAIQDGEIVYPNEPIITIKAPLIQAKILETPILNIMNMNMGIATKASMVTRAADPIKVLAFGSRRAHGFDSAVEGNKAAIIGGCYGHSNLVTEYKYGIPSNGTMSHSYIQAFGVGAEAEKEAFVTFIKNRRQRKSNSLILLVDTYDAIHIGIENAIKAFKECGIDDSYEGVYGVRLDSGDLAYQSKKCRKRFDEEGFTKAKITLTNSLDEKLIRSLREQGACVDMYGVGDAIAVSKSYPCFGGVYKIVELDEEPLIKISGDVIKISNPGFKEVYRIFDKDGFAYADLISLVKNDKDKEKLLSFKDENNNWNIMRFIFSKWTLREGWDNPNVFTLCTLKNGSSDIAKKQEIGRGLRLPVDVTGNRCLDRNVNELTVIANDSYENFSRMLQEDFNKNINKNEVTSDLLLVTLEKSGIPKIKITSELVNEFKKELIEKRVMDSNNVLLKNGKEDIKEIHFSNETLQEHSIQIAENFVKYMVEKGTNRIEIANGDNEPIINKRRTFISEKDFENLFEEDKRFLYERVYHEKYSPSSF